MKSLNSKQSKKLAELKYNLSELESELEEAIEDFNDNVRELWADLVEDKLSDYNELVQKANNFCMEVRDSIQDYYNERSERHLCGRILLPQNAASWQASERGIAKEIWGAGSPDGRFHSGDSACKSTLTPNSRMRGGLKSGT